MQIVFFLFATFAKEFRAYNLGASWRNSISFAALKTDRSVLTWGNSNNGGDSSSVSSSLSSGVSVIYSTDSAFAAVKTDGSVATWGASSSGGDSSSVSSSLSSGVSVVYSTWSAFAAVKADGSVVTWGYSSYGGDSSSVSSSSFFSKISSAFFFFSMRALVLARYFAIVFQFFEKKKNVCCVRDRSLLLQ